VAVSIAWSGDGEMFAVSSLGLESRDSVSLSFLYIKVSLVWCVAVSIAWSGDGEMFAVGSFNTLRLCDKVRFSSSYLPLGCFKLNVCFFNAMHCFRDGVETSVAEP
jgi:hypothetical protein